MKLAILDRDGTLGTAGPADAGWAALPGALEAVARLNRAGWHVVLATNQPGLALGELGMAELNALHASMHRALGAVGARIEAVFYCPHGPEEGCGCRQPAPGLLRQIGERYGAEPHETWVIGSSADHLQAGAQLGAHLHLVCEQTAATLQAGQPLPAEFPPQVRAHASLGQLVASLLPQDDLPPPA
ncbi:D-glycero-alpha-D-manno-heptose-1,7-bisphosphate 7-phosphatase [Comamonas endophytica]|uniref:D,D-heptose 1,7-bisphosphate phosphatase n=1 Tax=Comamonas endophytica TaxID=2949090 RepID=A0ABY6G802_9BURK|nr:MULTISPECIES: HAD-IIIA family hydrolase [unclassified Acidovorax]MCD2511096.1 HAD-IIIA family hydrolase [Acidovorax sp. D4N7]UYG50500.1 HAD-IIIA family hydrolase [Acidovorax sp. 5MLIR]